MEFENILKSITNNQKEEDLKTSIFKNIIQLESIISILTQTKGYETKTKLKLQIKKLKIKIKTEIKILKKLEKK